MAFISTLGLGAKGFIFGISGNSERFQGSFRVQGLSCP